MDAHILEFSRSGREQKQLVRQRLQQQLLKEPVAKVPENFYAEEFYFAIPLRKSDPKKYRDRLLFIVSAVAEGTLSPSFDYRFRFQIPQALSSDLLKKVLGSNYTAYVSTLVNNDVIEVATEQRWGAARKYVLGSRYQFQPFKYRRYQDPQIQRRIRLTRKQYLASIRKNYLAYAPLLCPLWDHRLEIDEDGAQTFYDEFLNKALYYVESKR